MRFAYPPYRASLIRPTVHPCRNKPASLRAAFKRHDGRMCISSITDMELVYGAEGSMNPERNLTRLEGIVARMAVLPLDESAAVHAGQIRAELAKQGTPIGPYDQLIAGHARSQGLVLVTNNEKEFSRVAGLRVENWVPPSLS
ncbi:tRNA(fMet)-specific endonuclease VapC [Thiohalocapsa marina]|uniref:Ribonuclease VapC n=1 Tax=Thiohalocapsa marina TaxID=424902 RepID=A0A5M8FSN6_9GAMM|nr:tRNA(fMet)-specific endonuclease VapC [Thiohalocapsa marina]KAA6185412.1 tRNA(fMet)-specific endonuclease VapC [Thiohalocapsa marina]